jgi:hypothetical protein
MTSRLIARGASYFFCIFLSAAFCWAQTGSGNIQGTVKDASGAVVPHAKVTLVHTATNRQYSSVTNDVGFYLIPGLELGAYELTVEFTGMETWKGTLTLLAGQTADVATALKTGGTATTVTVAGDITPLVTTTSPTLATVVETERIQQLPIDGRSITTLLYMTTPGVLSDPNGFMPRVYGLRNASEMMEDGAIMQNGEWGGVPYRQPGLDTVSEFRSETNNSSAKMDRPGSFIITTKSGTNALHGSLFETARNSGIGVARSRTDYFTKPPHLVRNEFGASAGGPVIIPKLYNGKNKTFFFTAFEGYRLRQATTRSISVFTPAMERGDYSALTDSSGRPITIYDPWSVNTTTYAKTPYPNNQIPIASEAPLSKYLYSVTPLPTTADNPLINANWFGLGFNRTNQMTETVKIDHSLSDRDHLSFRQSHLPSNQANTSSPYGQSPATTDGLANIAVHAGQNDSGVANWTHTFSPTFFSESLVTVSRDFTAIQPYTGTQEIDSRLGFPNPFHGFGFPRLPYSLNTSTSTAMSYDSCCNPNITYTHYFNIDQNFTKIKGRHEFQFGVRYRWETLHELEDQHGQQGELDYNNLSATAILNPNAGNTFTALNFTGSAAAQFFLGVGAYNARFNRQAMPVKDSEKAAYFQDNFKVNSRLTLNFGVRYELNVMPYFTDNSGVSFDSVNHKIILGTSLDKLIQLKDVNPLVVAAYQTYGLQYETAKQAGLPSNLVHTNYKDFNPRAGFAYRITTGHKPFVVRGGFAQYGYPEPGRLYTAQFSLTQPYLGVFQNNPNSASLSPDGLSNYFLRAAPTIVAGLNSADALNLTSVTIAPGGGQMFYLNPHQPTEKSMQWNLTFEKEVMANTAVRVGYIGQHGYNAPTIDDFNEPIPSYIWYSTTHQPLPTGPFAGVSTRTYDTTGAYGEIQEYDKAGWSNTSAIQVEVEHRYAKGYAFQMFYVMSNVMRAGGDSWFGNGYNGVQRPDQFLPNAVPTDLHDRIKLLWYARDPTVPKHAVNANFLVDLPFGKGKLLGRNSRRLMDAIIGGWQTAGNFTLTSSYTTLTTNFWGPYNKVQTYGKQYPIQNCVSGVCYGGYLYWNGYIQANLINRHNAAGACTGICGIPSNYQPFAQPFYPTPANGGSSSDPNAQYYETNTAFVPLSNGSTQVVSYNPTLNPMQNQYFLGPFHWAMTASLFKTLRLTEKVMLRINADFLNNVFNMPGTPNPNSTSGLISTQGSYNAPRTLQLTGRLTF